MATELSLVLYFPDGTPAPTQEELEEIFEGVEIVEYDTEEV